MIEDLESALESPQTYRLADVPRSLTWDEVRRMLTAVDRRTILGRRDYAILISLRAKQAAVAACSPPSETTAVRLGNVGWRQDQDLLKWLQSL